MKKAIIIMIFMVLLINGRSFAMDKGSIDFEELAKSVLLLYCYDKDGNLAATGSGFVAFDERTIITNYHVIEGITKVIAENEYGSEIVITHIANYDLDRDVAILVVDEDTGLKPLSIGDSSLIKKGDEVYTIGSPEGLINTVSSGLVSGEIMIADQVYLQISAPISSGSSGGVLLNSAGQVIGITSAGYVEGQNLNFAIPINDAIEINNKAEGIMTLRSCAAKEDPDFNLKTYPAWTGKLIARCYDPAEQNISVTTYGDGIFYIYLKNTAYVSPSNKDYSFLVMGGDSFEMEIADGTYEVFYGCGDTWYGGVNLLGHKADYYILNDPLAIYTNEKVDSGFGALDQLIEGKTKQDDFLVLYQFPDVDSGAMEIEISTFPSAEE